VNISDLTVPRGRSRSSRAGYFFRVNAIAFALAVIALAGCGSSSTHTTTVTSSAATTSTPTTNTSTTSAAKGKSPSDPIPFGSTGSIEGWTVKVVSLVTEPADKVYVKPAEAAGYAFEVYTLEVTRTAAEAQSPILLTPKLLGPSKTERSSIASPVCLGGEPYNDKVHQGGTAKTGGCISVPASDVGHLLLGVGFSGEIWFATPTQSTVASTTSTGSGTTGSTTTRSTAASTTSTGSGTTGSTTTRSASTSAGSTAPNGSTTTRTGSQSSLTPQQIRQAKQLLGPCRQEQPGTTLKELEQDLKTYGTIQC
jgi:hypothetical protein